MVGMTGNIASSKVAQGTDKKGRWSWAQLIGKKGRAVLIISAYRVSQSYPSAAGYTTAFMQQYRALLKENVSKPKPRTQCLVDLELFITNWKAQNTESSVILMMDANGDSSDTQIQTFMADTALHDVVEHHSPHLIHQSTYKQGIKRIDFILISEDLLAASRKAGHTPFDVPFISDHRGVYWNIPYLALFDSRQDKPTPTSQRGLQLDRPRTIGIYISYSKII